MLRPHRCHLLPDTNSTTLKVKDDTTLRQRRLLTENSSGRPLQTVKALRKFQNFHSFCFGFNLVCLSDKFHRRGNGDFFAGI